MKEGTTEKLSLPPPAKSPPQPPKGWGETLKAHLDKYDMGEGWTRLSKKDDGPDVGKSYETRRRKSDEDQTAFSNDVDESDGGAAGPTQNRSPLSRELDPDADVTHLLDDYDTLADAQDQQEIANAVASITVPEDIEMTDAETTPGDGLNPELAQHGYDQHFARETSGVEPGSMSPVSQRDDEMLDDSGKAPGTGRPGSLENAGRKITGKKK